MVGATAAAAKRRWAFSALVAKQPRVNSSGDTIRIRASRQDSSWVSGSKPGAIRPIRIGAAIQTTTSTGIRPAITRLKIADSSRRASARRSSTR